MVAFNKEGTGCYIYVIGILHFEKGLGSSTLMGYIAIQNMRSVPIDKFVVTIHRFNISIVIVNSDYMHASFCKKIPSISRWHGN